MQDFALPFVELHEVPGSPLLQPVEIPLDGNVILKSAIIRLVCKTPNYTQSGGILFNSFLHEDWCWVVTLS